MIRPCLLGIAGPSCSGKSRLAAALARACGETVVVPLDAYYHDLGALPGPLGATCNFDHPDALDRPLLLDQLGRLARGDGVRRPVYDFASHTRTGSRLVHPQRLVIVEGLFSLYWPELRRLLTRAVFLDVAPEVALARRLERDAAERGRDAESVRAQFARTVLPMYDTHVRPTRRHADLVLRGEAPIDELVASVTACLAGAAEGERPLAIMPVSGRGTRRTPRTERPPMDERPPEPEQLPPYVIEGARSSRAKCKTCRRKIDLGALRIGILIEGPYGTGYMWHHLRCAARRQFERVEEAYRDEAWNHAKQPPKNVPSLESLGKLREQAEQRRRGRKAIPYVEPAPTGRARCKRCGESIDKDSMRVTLGRGVEFGGQVRTSPVNVHPACVAAELASEECNTPVEGFAEALRANSADVSGERVDEVLRAIGPL